MKSFQPLIYAVDAENITIKGEGTLDGQGKKWWMEFFRVMIDLKDNGMGLPMLQTRIPDTKRFRKEADGTGRTVFRSTLLAPDRRMLAGSGIPELTREIATILKLEGYEETAE